MKKTKVSIIVPVYNVEEYLSKCLDSLVNQTLKDIEIIIVNDGTKDNSEKIIKEYLKKYSFIKYYKKENGGLSSARNYGMKYATGEFIGFVDSDDYVELNMFEELYNKAKSTNSDVVCSQVTYRYNKYIEKKYFENPNGFETSVSKNPSLLMEVKSYAWNKIYKKELWNGFEFPNQYFEDSAIIYNVLYTANKISCVNKPLYNYVKERPGAITNQISNKIYDIFKSCDSILAFYSKQKDYKKLKDAVEGLCIRHLMIRLLYIYDSKNRKITWKFYNDAIKYLKNNIKNYKNNPYLRYKKTNDKLFNTKIRVIKMPGFFKFVSLMPIKFFNKMTEFTKRVYKHFKRKFTNNKEEKRLYIQKNGYMVLDETLKLLNSIPGVKGFADFGTMLGLVREKGLLKHDLDMDIGVIGKNSICDTVRMVLEDNGYELWREYVYGDIIVEHSYHYKNIKVDINYYAITNKGVKTWLFYHDPEKKYKRGYMDVVEMNYSNIDSLKKIKIKNKFIYIPTNAEQILEEKYGKTWKIPDKGWIYWKSPAASKMDGQGHYITCCYITEENL